jgi:putative adenylate-forming enzyme
MRRLEWLGLLAAFIRTRWFLRFRDRAALERWQHRQLARFIDGPLRRAPFYRACPGRALAALPIVDKALTLRHFAAFNTRGIALAEATAAAIAAEHAQPWPAGFDADLSAGLSSGTRGPRGVFLASGRERAAWAGILLARTLERTLLKDVLLRREPLRVAFFLRANSALYMTLKSRRIDFRFFDLQAGAHTHLDALQQFDPEVLVAPASVLAWLAAQVLAGHAMLAPRRVIAVAEVLEPQDESLLQTAFGTTVHQLYQCTEGFLAYTCEHGVLHLNEEFVHIEPQWLDAQHTRFVPIVTDFTRRTQMIVRYRLDDILRVRAAPCACGRVTRALEAIDGRLDDVLWLPAAARPGALLPVFPDALRHALATCAVLLADYRIEQHGDTLHLALAGDAAVFAAVTAALERHFAAQGMRPLAWRQIELSAWAPAHKRRRIVCVQRPVPADQPAAAQPIGEGDAHHA